MRDGEHGEVAEEGGGAKTLWHTIQIVIIQERTKLAEPE